MSPSMCIQKENHTTLGLAADNSRKERVSFQGKLKDPLIFRDAMLMLREIVISGKEIEKKREKNFLHGSIRKSSEEYNYMRNMRPKSEKN